MALTYTESAALMTDPTFRGRIKVACLKYADSILIADTPVSMQSGLVRWALRAFQMPDTVAQETQPPTVMDGAVQADGAAISDGALQGSLEAVVRKLV